MAAGRPEIPRPMARDVRVEAGHRCAIPTCRATSGLQIHHINEWAKVREHAFENLILVCANCHSRITGGEIDRGSVLAYKSNLSILTSRYGDLERRILDRFVKQPGLAEVVVDTSQLLLLDYLISDGVLEYLGAGEGALYFQPGELPPDEPSAPEDHYGPARWGLTVEGRRLVDHVREAQELE
jgi:hypothetical protein